MKTVLITGTNRGIGLATVKLFLAHGWNVIATSKRGTAGFAHADCVSVALDVSHDESIKTSVAEIKTLAPHGIDVVVNNAGVLLDKNQPAVDIEKLRMTLQVNLIGLIDFTEQLLPLLNSGGHIIQISSMAASLTQSLEGLWIMPAYKISKAAVNMYTRTLAQRLEPNDITVSSLDPGWVKTDMGGEDAERTPDEAAQDIYNLATSSVETGFFWLNGSKRDW